MSAASHNNVVNIVKFQLDERERERELQGEKQVLEEEKIVAFRRLQAIE